VSPGRIRRLLNKSTILSNLIVDYLASVGRVIMSFHTDSQSDESTRQWIETKGRTLISLDQFDIENQDDEEAGYGIPEAAEIPETAARQPTVLETPLETTPLQITQTTPLETNSPSTPLQRHRTA
jgi:hypothetical protein